MDTWDIRLAARALGIKLCVTRDDVLTAEPARLLTPALRAAILVHKADLLFDLLLADALRYVAVEHYAEAVRPLSRIEREVGGIMRETTGHLGSGERAWGQILNGIRDQRFGDPEVRAHRLQKQANQAAANKA